VSDIPGRLVLLGHPVAHSLSPVFQNAALSDARIHVRYEALDIPPSRLSQALDELVKTNAAGNATIPHKLAVARACGRLTTEAERIGAVNTFAVRDGTLVGHNTDVAGFDRAARELLGQSPAGLTVGVFGAGGAAAAVLAAVEAWGGCTAVVINRNRARASALCERFRSTARVGDAEEIANHADIVVNATSLGMHSDEPGPIDPAHLRRATAVLDLVYTPNETAFVRAARSRGIRATDGLSMLLAQGAESFAWWFGRRPNVEVMWRAVGRSPQLAS
jgi:shikimate dehydrogenase